MLGSLLIWKLGTVGVWVGVLLLVHAAFRAWELAQMVFNPAGKIIITEQQVTLPRGRSVRKPLQVKPDDVTAVYFLRRSVPWNHAAPVLVVELGPYALAYPRDWFASEADQRHVVHALMTGLGTPGEVPAAVRATLDASVKLDRVKLAIGGVLLAVGLALWVATAAPVGTTSLYAFYVAPIIAGVTLIWRWLTRL